MIDKKRVIEIIDKKQQFFTDLSDKIWDNPELSFLEYKSSEFLCEALENEGFTVTRGIAGIPTAFVGSYGNGQPVIAFLGEFDALSGLSQKSENTTKEPIIDGADGHGCGHNLLGVGSLAAAVAVKKYIEENGISGTVRYYGCSGEEGGSGKAFMAREKVFDDVDIALTWHPMAYNSIFATSSLANYQVYYRFHGTSAHAAASPHLGRSALDAVELMNVGVNYLREHIIQEARVHYAVTNTGGISPNVVQPEAEVLYLMRAPKTSQVQEIYERINDIARGAALMTGTKCEIIFGKACSNLVPNKTLEEVLYKNFTEIGLPDYDENDLEFAAKMKNTLCDSEINSDLNLAFSLMGREHKEIIDSLKNKDLYDVILPYKYWSMTMPGSTDVGDVSWNVPTAQIITACCALGTAPHSWQMTSQGKSGIAHKGMLLAGKVLAATAIDALLNPGIIKNAKADLIKVLDGETYSCPIPPEVKPLPDSSN